MLSKLLCNQVMVPMYVSVGFQLRFYHELSLISFKRIATTCPAYYGALIICCIRMEFMCMDLIE